MHGLIDTLTATRTVVTDGAWGTQLQALGLEVGACPDAWNLSEPDKVLQEFHRVLKPGGILSFRDHHMKEEEILSKVTTGNLFKLATKGRKTYSFSKES